MESKDFFAVGAGALGKQKDWNAGLEHGCHLSGRPLGAGATLAVEEDGCARAGKEAEGRPAADFLLGHEDAGSGGCIDQNVEVAEVVGTDKALGGTLAAAFQIYP